MFIAAITKNASQIAFFMEALSKLSRINFKTILHFIDSAKGLAECGKLLNKRQQNLWISEKRDVALQYSQFYMRIINS